MDVTKADGQLRHCAEIIRIKKSRRIVQETKVMEMSVNNAEAQHEFQIIPNRKDQGAGNRFSVLIAPGQANAIEDAGIDRDLENVEDPDSKQAQQQNFPAGIRHEGIQDGNGHLQEEPEKDVKLDGAIPPPGGGPSFLRIFIAMLDVDERSGEQTLRGIQVEEIKNPLVKKGKGAHLPQMSEPAA